MQIGVKSFGCEKSTAHESPIQSWKLIGPSVVSAVKSGAVSFSCNAMRQFLLSIPSSVWIQNHNAVARRGYLACAPRTRSARLAQELDRGPLGIGGGCQLRMRASGAAEAGSAKKASTARPTARRTGTARRDGRRPGTRRRSRAGPRRRRPASIAASKCSGQIRTIVASSPRLRLGAKRVQGRRSRTRTTHPARGPRRGRPERRVEVAVRRHVELLLLADVGRRSRPPRPPRSAS